MEKLTSDIYVEKAQKKFLEEIGRNWVFIIGDYLKLTTAYVIQIY